MEVVLMDAAHNFLVQRKMWLFDESGLRTKRTSGRDLLVECIAFAAAHNVEKDYVNQYAKKSGDDGRKVWRYIRHYLDSYGCKDSVEDMVRCGADAVRLIMAGKGAEV